MAKRKGPRAEGAGAGAGAGADAARGVGGNPSETPEAGERIAAARARPLQKRKTKADEFTPAKIRVFLRHLMATCNVTRSAAEAGVTTATVYNLRLRSDGFRAEWNEALGEGYARLEMLLLQHAADPLPEPLFADGEMIEDARPFDKHLAMDLFKQHKALVTTGKGRTAHNRREPTIDEVRDELLKRLSRLRKPRGGPA